MEQMDDQMNESWKKKWEQTAVVNEQAAWSTDSSKWINSNPFFREAQHLEMLMAVASANISKNQRIW